MSLEVPKFVLYFVKMGVKSVKESWSIDYKSGVGGGSRFYLSEQYIDMLVRVVCPLSVGMVLCRFIGDKNMVMTGGINGDWVCDRFGIDRRRYQRCLSELCGADILVMAGRGKYMVNPYFYHTLHSTDRGVFNKMFGYLVSAWGVHKKVVEANHNDELIKQKQNDKQH